MGFGDSGDQRRVECLACGLYRSGFNDDVAIPTIKLVSERRGRGFTTAAQPRKHIADRLGDFSIDRAPINNSGVLVGTLLDIGVCHFDPG